ncbi:MAG: hypothetical protein HRU19_31395 [Pseudobacteriovorax sp.]|nr:hypothetical protein [Pseudobacteriovorax sp.]
MTSRVYNRREILKMGSLSAGVICSLSGQAIFAADGNTPNRIENIIYANVPGAKEDPEFVASFARKLASDRVAILEDRRFIDEASQEFDDMKFSRFVVIEFLTSSTFLIGK